MILCFSMAVVSLMITFLYAYCCFFLHIRTLAWLAMILMKFTLKLALTMMNQAMNNSLSNRNPSERQSRGCV